MDFYLSWNNNEGVMTFPVIPNGGVTLSRKQDNKTFESINGQIQAIGNLDLATFEISSIFPMRKYSWARPGSYTNGWMYCTIIENIRKRGIPFRAIFVGNRGEQVFNLPVTVDSFEYTLDSAGDVAYTISFTEYRFANITADTVQEQVFTGTSVKTEAQKEADTQTITEGGQTVTFEKKYTDSDAVAMAKVMFCESRGIKSRTEIACIGWTILNRLDKGGYGSSIYGVITAKNQFAYRANAKTVSDYGYDLVELSKDVLNRWSREKAGQSNVGRVLPNNYFWYYGNGVHNFFYNDYSKFRINNRNYAWNYSYPSPYA